MQSSGQMNEMIQPGDLEALAKVRGRGPIFSLYLGRHSRDVRALTGRFDQLLQQAQQHGKLGQASHTYRQQWNEEAQRIHAWLQREQPQSAQGLAIFSSQPADLWRAWALPVTLADRLVVRGQAFIRPLEILLAEFGCTLVVLLDAGTARLLKVLLGSVQEVENLQTVPVTGDALEIGPRLYARSVAEQVAATWQEQPCARLVIGGSPELVEGLKEELPEPLHQRLAGVLTLSQQDDMEELLAQVQEIEEDQERHIESQHVKDLLARGKKNQVAVLGVEQSLLAVRDQRARLLVVEEGFRTPGGECINCGYLGIYGAASDQDQIVCPFCGMALRPEPDVIEVALKRVLDQGGEIEVLRSPESHHGLEDYGHIGALLREPVEPVVRDMATQRVIARDGEINWDVLYDETIEESFPASDPPGWTH